MTLLLGPHHVPDIGSPCPSHSPRTVPHAPGEGQEPHDSCKQARAVSVSPAVKVSQLGSWPKGNTVLVLCLLLSSPSRA